MTKNEYIEAIENLIINKIKYHAPLISERVDYSILDAIGIDGKYPIFMFNKPLDKIFYKAFSNAKKKVEFNLILTEKPLVSIRKATSLEKTFLLYNEEIGSVLGNTLNQLNINYISHSDFKKELRKEYIKVNDKEISFDYLPFYLSKKVMENGIITEAKCFLLNGKNYILNFINTSNLNKKISFEFNLPLPRGYYIFKRTTNAVEIENLINKERAYFNYNFKNIDISFSTMNGIESCTFACINVNCKINLLPKESKKLYLNFGENKYNIPNPKDMEYFFELSQIKMNEIFDIRVTTRDNKFDELFNLSLPRNIWEKWQNFDVDEQSENTYIKMRKELITQEKGALQISKTFKGLKEVKFFRNKGWKRVFIVHNKACYLFVDRVKYYNFTLLTKDILEKNNEIYLSFAD